MNKIRVMNELLSNKIAAGEVVEKCVSVVKELTENSVDAGSDEIKIEVKEAGTKLIRVIDNGCGMDSNVFPLRNNSKVIKKCRFFE